MRRTYLRLILIHFTSTGHAGAMLQARQLGTELYVGIHSDESILENKGPTVMTLEERYCAIIVSSSASASSQKAHKS